jgi:Acetyltransferase (GNAT) domain
LEAGTGVIAYAVKTTSELTAAEIVQLRELFTDVFQKPFPEDVLRRKYAGSCLGHSFHSLMLDGDRIVGAFSAIPVRYRFFGTPVLFAPTADLMIAQPHRGPVRQLQMLGQGLFERLREAGVAFVFACLREEMKMVHQAVSRWRTVGKVFYYAAPFNPLVRCALRLAPAGAPDPGAGKWPIEKINDEQFAQYRYKVFPVPYQNVPLPGGGAIYTNEFFYPIEGLPSRLRLGLLLDVWPLDAATFNRAVTEIRRREPRLHALAYQGRLPFRPREMFRVPARFEKKSWFVAGRILRDDLVDERIFDISHWNINLSNGDLV